MRPAPHDDPTEAARRRLALLRQELDQAGLGASASSGTSSGAPPVAPSPAATDSSEAPAEPAPLLDSGRHARVSASPLARVRGLVADRVPATLRGRVGWDGSTFAVVAVIGALGLALTAWAVLRSGSGSEPVPEVATGSMGSLTATASPSMSPSISLSVSPGAAGGSGPASAVDVVIDVAGRVRRPGVFTLPAGSRVVDALARAGGLRPGARLLGLNRARVLVDGEQILVGVAPAPGVAAGAASVPGAPAPGALTNLNTATESQLEELPGVGPVTAGKIAAWRTQHGRFSSVDELLEVDGIGEKTLAELAPHVTL